MWIIENGGKIKGSICVIDRGEHDAQLRLFGMDASLQGKGAGKALMQTAMDYCKKMQYTHVSLWTIDICKQQDICMQNLILNLLIQKKIIPGLIIR